MEHNSTHLPDLLATKLLIPRLRPALVERERLYHRLDAGIQHHLTLISAPAGFGKTTLVAGWLQRAARRTPTDTPPGSEGAYPALRSAWVSLDDDDNDPVRFWRYLLGALDGCSPGVCAPYLSHLNAPQPPPIDALLTALINTLAEQRDTWVLVLDDYHLITEPAIHRAVMLLLSHPPACLRVVLLTRADPPLPLARLRASQSLLELRADDLRCTDEEARAFLGEVMHLRLSAVAAASVGARTEGWLAGMQLFGLWLQGRADPEALLDDLSGRQAYVMDYLAEQVWARLSEDLRLFLLRTSILDRLNPPLCDAVAGQPRSQERLRQLERANLFLVPLDHERRWFRYHHLFAEMLRACLERERGHELSLLHRRASRWYAEQGDRRAAIEHALKAHDWQAAAELLDQLCARLNWGERESQVAKLRRWLDALPEPELRGRARLSFAYAYVRYATASGPELESWLQSAERALGAQPDAEGANLRGEILAFRTFLLSTSGDMEGALALSTRSLAHLGDWNRAARADVLFTQAIAAYTAGEARLAVERARAAAAEAGAAGCRATAATHLGLAGRYAQLGGWLHEAQQLAEQALAQARLQPGLDLPMACWALAAQADLFRERDRLEPAAQSLAEAIRLSDQAGSILFSPTKLTLMARLAQAQGDLTAAEAAHAEGERLPPALRLMHLSHALVDRVTLLVRRGELLQAVRWLATIKEQLPTTSRLAHDRVAVAELLLLLAEHRHAEALGRVDALLTRARAQQRWDELIELLLLRGLAHQSLGDQGRALRVVAVALRLARPQGYIRRFVDHGAPLYALLVTLRARRSSPAPYLDVVLKAFPAALRAELRPTAHVLASVTKRSEDLIEPLSARECEVLGLLAQGASNLAIAAALAIAPNTVKHHVSSILGKLGASNRTQAMERARTLGLLSAGLSPTAGREPCAMP